MVDVAREVIKLVTDCGGDSASKLYVMSEMLRTLNGTNEFQLEILEDYVIPNLAIYAANATQRLKNPTITDIQSLINSVRMVSDTVSNYIATCGIKRLASSCDLDFQNNEATIAKGRNSATVPIINFSGGSIVGRVLNGHIVLHKLDKPIGEGERVDYDYFNPIAVLAFGSRKSVEVVSGWLKRLHDIMEA